ncbi:hypothetical protein [Roseiconus lacunae]|uniref:hypothetical protein n=1 Tax=Roseiconus lacunae TaxID=2605694 RepID=UPI00135A96BE|nr:hypothetical protein [Roseiconus lacunae]
MSLSIDQRLPGSVRRYMMVRRSTFQVTKCTVPRQPLDEFLNLDIEFDFSTVTPIVPDEIGEVALVTVHFNPTGSRRLSETFWEWLPSLGVLRDVLQVVEVTFPKSTRSIEFARLIEGGPQHWMWQKEAMINRVIANLPPNITMVGWIDHDLCLTRRSWLVDAIELLRKGADAVQLFERVIFLDMNHREIHQRGGRVAGLKTTRGGGCPGGAWIAKRSLLETMGGLPITNVVGSGDEIFAQALLGPPADGQLKSTLFDTSPGLVASYQDYIAQGRSLDPNVRHVRSLAYHLWHGRKEDRQYLSREAILKRHCFDPAQDIAIDPNGLLRWASDKPELHREVREYFVNRRDDEP